MTRFIRLRFRRLVLVAAISGGAAALALGTAAAANAASAWNGPTPTATPTQVYGQHHQKTHCEFILMTGKATDHDQSKRSDNQPQPYQDVTSIPAAVPSSLYPSIAAGEQSDQRIADQRKAEEVEVFQVVKFCEQGEQTWSADVTAPFAFETEPQPVDFTMPTGQPSGLPPYGG